MQKMYRQGDILIIATTEEVPAEAKLVQRDGGKIVLAYGEKTGHSHAIAERGVKLFETPEIRWITSDKPFTICHEEHAPVEVPAGTFRVIRQREYVAPAIVRQVID